MIAANELRIGNWYDFKNIMNGKYKPIQFNNWAQALDFESYGELIPLTSEILEKAGFENDGGKFSHPDNTDFDLMFSCSENGLWCAYNYGGEFHGPFSERTPQGITANPICNPFKYVHQLQNLYFALTGEELPITL